MALVIIGCGLGPEDLTEKMRRKIAMAEVLAGGRRLLDWFPENPAERVVLDAAARRQAAELLARAATARVVVLASGDPLFFGIAGTFLDVAAAANGNPPIEIIPNVSAVQAACARAGLNWNRIEFFNLHGKASQVPWRRILRAPGGALLLAGPGEKNPGRLAAALVAEFPAAGKRKAIVFADLGKESEVVHHDDLEAIAGRDWPALSLLYLAPADASSEMPWPACGLPVDEFAHEAGLITKEEVRAVILAKLRLVPGILWDLGAGSGSVAVEAASMQPGLKVFAVEKEPSRVELIRANALKHGVSESIEVIDGDIPAVIDRLPAPDRVFIGGGGEEIGRIAETAFARLLPGGIMVAAAVTLESRAELSRVLKDYSFEVVEINIARSRPLGGLRLLKSENPIGLYIYRKGV